VRRTHPSKPPRNPHGQACAPLGGARLKGNLCVFAQVLPPLLRMAKYFHEDVRSKAMYALAQV
jgi:hypothetical protein